MFGPAGDNALFFAVFLTSVTTIIGEPAANFIRQAVWGWLVWAAAFVWAGCVWLHHALWPRRPRGQDLEMGARKGRDGEERGQGGEEGRGGGKEGGEGENEKKEDDDDEEIRGFF